MEEDPGVHGHRVYVGTTSEGEAAVGRIAIWAAAVEHNLTHLCLSLINSSDPDVGYAVTANMSASAVIQLTKRLASDSKSITAKDKTEVMAMLTEAKAALEQRNKILHATVGELMLEGKTVFFNRRRIGPAGIGQPHWETNLRDVEELDDIGARLFRVSEELWGWVNLPPDQDPQP